MEIADAEVFALNNALSFACQSPTENTRRVYIFVDSQAAIARLQNRQGNKAIQHAAAAAEKLRTQGISIHIQWCLSHMGIAGNKMADILAKKGVNGP